MAITTMASADGATRCTGRRNRWSRTQTGTRSGSGRLRRGVLCDNRRFGQRDRSPFDEESREFVWVACKPER